MKYSSYDHFVGDIAEFRQRLELHRLKCQRLFICCALLGVLMIISLPWVCVPIAQYLNTLFANMVGGDWKPHASVYEVISVAFLLFFAGLALILWPIFSYRGKESAGGHVARGYSLQDHVYSNLLARFGDFSFATNGGVLLADMHKATILPEHHHYSAEDCAVGVMHDCKVKLAQTNLTRTIEGRRESVFRGIAIVIDVSDSKIKLRRNFSGRTVLIADSKKHSDSVKSRYHSYDVDSLQDTAVESEFEAFSNSPDEARVLLNSDIVKHITDLKKSLANLSSQTQHIDDRIAYAAAALLGSFWISRRRPLQAEKEYEARFSYGLDLTKGDPLSDAADAVHESLCLEFYEDKFVILLPCKHDLFETNSLFEPAINDEDLAVLFNLMSALDKITHRLQQHLSS